MSTVIRLITLLTIAAAGFAMPMSCAQTPVAAANTVVEIPYAPSLETRTDTDTGALPTEAQTTESLTQQLLDRLPLDCGDEVTPSASEHLGTVDTQPFVPGFLVSTTEVSDADRADIAPPPVLAPVESRAGPPDAPPPKSIS
ncbi:MAG: hypothetical protein KC438_02575 [Thermomicrobiales bacterium]|nr:hypothetical protein [Thermomicrobiales bacterium]MCO5220646.1 hypothetical protein [Thermomicrobiales bacterium]